MIDTIFAAAAQKGPTADKTHLQTGAAIVPIAVEGTKRVMAEIATLIATPKVTLK